MSRPASVSEWGVSKPLVGVRGGFDSGRSFVATRLNQLGEGCSRPGSTGFMKWARPDQWARGGRVGRVNWEWVTGAEEAVVVRRRPASPGAWADWPGWLDAELVDGFRAAGIDRPWRHQVELAELDRAGRARKRVV